MRAPLPDWDRICKKIVDGEVQHDKCRRVLSDALGDFQEGEGPEESFFDRLMQGDPAAIAMVALPLGALFWYVYFYDKGTPAPQQVVKTA